MHILRQAMVSRPVRDGWGGEAVCGRGATGGFRRGGITNGTAEIPSACGRCSDGRQRSGNGSAGPNPRDASGTRRRNASGDNNGHLNLKNHLKTSLPPRTRLRRLARGHAAESFQRFSATVPAVMIPLGILLAPLRRIAGTTAARPCTRPETANASGCGARPKRADSSATWNTRPHGPNAVKVMSLPATWRRGSPCRGPV